MDFHAMWNAREQTKLADFQARMKPLVAWARAYWVGHQVWWYMSVIEQVCYGFIESVDDRGWLQVIDSYDEHGNPRYLKMHASTLDRTLFLLPENGE